MHPYLLLKQGYRYHKLCKTFSKFYRQYYDLISKFQVGLKSLLRQGLSEPENYGDLVYKGPQTVLMKNCPQKGPEKNFKENYIFSMKKVVALTLELSTRAVFSLDK